MLFNQLRPLSSTSIYSQEMAPMPLPTDYTVQQSSSFELLPTELLTEILENVAGYQHLEGEKKFLDVTALSTLTNVCTTWSKVALSLAKIHPQFRFTELCDISNLNHFFNVSQPNPISISLEFPARLPSAEYWRFLVALFQYSGRFIELSICSLEGNYTMLSKALLRLRFPLLETLRVVRVKESRERLSIQELYQAYLNRHPYVTIPKLDLDSRNLRCLHLDGVEWKGPLDRRDFSRLESVFIKETSVEWLSMSTFATLKRFTVSGMSNGAFLLRDTDISYPSSSLSYLRIDKCAPCFIFEDFHKSSITTLVLSSLTATNWVDIIRYIQASQASPSSPSSPSSLSPPSLSLLPYQSSSLFGNVRSLEISFQNSGAAAYGADTQKLYPRFYKAFERLESLTVRNGHCEEYFGRPLRGDGVCTALKSIEINGRKMNKSDF
ncbi:hypothetical protein BDQ17DRAFT_1360786, partial [Cyathus striatus]